MPATAAGEFTKRITVERRLPDTGTRGEATGNWYVVAMVAARYEPLAGNELEVARERIATASGRLTIRRPRQWTPNARDRVTFDGRTMYVATAPVEINERADVVFLVSEQVPK